MKTLPKFDTIFSKLPSSIKGSSFFPPLTCRKNQGGGGYEASIVFILNEAIHATVYKNTWDEKREISGQLLGPFCLHITAQAVDHTFRWFRQYDLGSGIWDYVPGPNDDNSPDGGHVARSIELIIAAISSYLSSQSFHDEL